jgi:hypothetical protein
MASFLEIQGEKNKHAYEPVSNMEFLKKRSGLFLVAKPPFFWFLHKQVQLGVAGVQNQDKKKCQLATMATLVFPRMMPNHDERCQSQCCKQGLKHQF